MFIPCCFSAACNVMRPEGPSWSSEKEEWPTTTFVLVSWQGDAAIHRILALEHFPYFCSLFLRACLTRNVRSPLGQRAKMILWSLACHFVVRCFCYHCCLRVGVRGSSLSGVSSSVCVSCKPRTRARAHTLSKLFSAVCILQHMLAI